MPVIYSYKVYLFKKSHKVSSVWNNIIIFRISEMCSCIWLYKFSIAITNHHRLSALKQHKHISLTVPESEMSAM